MVALAAALALALRVAQVCGEEATCKAGRAQTVHAAFYLWYGNPESDGRWLHWDHKVLPHWDPKVDAQHRKFKWRPPDEHHAPFRPQRGLFSARSNMTLREQFADLALAGVDSAMISWWGRKEWTGKRDDADSGANTDKLVPAVLEAAQHAGVFVSFHVEPYGGRTPDTFLEDLRYIHEEYGPHPAVWREGKRSLPVFWLYDVSAQHSRQEIHAWRRALDSVRGTRLDGIFMCLWIGERGDAEFVEEAGFDGAYTYFAALGFTPGSNPQNWPSIKRALAKRGKLFVPAVGPGYDDTLIRPWNAHNVRDRRLGDYYDTMWDPQWSCNRMLCQSHLTTSGEKARRLSLLCRTRHHKVESIKTMHQSSLTSTCSELHTGQLSFATRHARSKQAERTGTVGHNRRREPLFPLAALDGIMMA